MRLQNPFAAISPSGLDSQVLDVLARSEASLSIGQIHALLPEGGSRVGVRNSVARFVEQGTVREQSVGRARGYSINDEHLIAGPIREIAHARRRLIERIAAQVESWPAQPIVVTLFGSAARGAMLASSDLDLLVVVPTGADDDALEDRIGALSARVTAWTGNDARMLVHTSDDVSPAPAFDEIVRDGVHVFGDRDWLRRRIRREQGAA